MQVRAFERYISLMSKSYNDISTLSEDVLNNEDIEVFFNL